MRIVPAVPLFLSGLLLGSLLLLPRPSPGDSPPANPHAYFGQPAQCPRCHLYSGSKPDPGRISTASIEFCLGCHRAEGQNRTHPLSVHPDMRSMKVPPEYSLGDGEHVICLTCHSAHGPFVSNVRAFPGQNPILVDQAGGLPYYRTYFLRRPALADKMSQTLCSGCHGTL